MSKGLPRHGLPKEERRHTIFAGKTRERLVPNTYKAENRTICWLHLEIANLVVGIPVVSDKCQKILELIDEAFDCGKRMDQKLADYRKGKIPANLLSLAREDITNGTDK